jgi:hypothetical protein
MKSGLDLKDIKERYGNYYLVSTVNLYKDNSFPLFGEHTYETKIFACNKEGKVKSWLELYEERYYTKAEAIGIHKYILDNFEDIIFNGNYMKEEN